MSLTKNDVLHLAKLARLDLTAAEVDNYALQLDEVLHYLDKLNELGAVSPAEVLAGSALVGRVDEIEEFNNSTNLLKSAPAKEGDLIVVPPVFSANQ
ncbi:MAG: Asp-tRNA(Asn)/Glu-tRNA(Gln) amidotransferase subunit GatC [Candidatus Kerfeldbacteria bacterium]|nr:Asp-tRNA(Asn)/Glu-tRNA(Gln) amidotransferase subunit GatC [Candidatus Kerfeldbacteria bacterium]